MIGACQCPDQTLNMTDTTDFNFDEQIDRRQVPALKVHPMVLGEDSDKLFPAGVADMDFRAPPVALQAMQQRLEHGVFGYETVAEGLFPALKGWLEHRHGWQVDESHILRAPNVLNILAIATSLFTNEGDAVIIQPPVFFDFFDVLNENHRDIITNPLVLDNGRYQMDFDDLQQKAADPRAKMLYLCNPHNPVGRVWDKTELRQLAEICLQNNVLVVADEMHGDLTFPGHPYTPIASLGPAHAASAVSIQPQAKPDASGLDDFFGGVLARALPSRGDRR